MTPNFQLLDFLTIFFISAERHQNARARQLAETAAASMLLAQVPLSFSLMTLQATIGMSRYESRVGLSR